MEEEKGLKSYQVFRASMYDPRVKRQIAKDYKVNIQKIVES